MTIRYLHNDEDYGSVKHELRDYGGYNLRQPESYPCIIVWSYSHTLDFGYVYPDDFKQHGLSIKI